MQSQKGSAQELSINKQTGKQINRIFLNITLKLELKIGIIFLIKWHLQGI